MIPSKPTDIYELDFELAHMVLHASELLYKSARNEPLPDQDYLEFWASTIEDIANDAIMTYEKENAKEPKLPTMEDFGFTAEEAL
jgi:hypothetical protein